MVGNYLNPMKEKNVSCSFEILAKKNDRDGDRIRDLEAIGEKKC